MTNSPWGKWDWRFLAFICSGLFRKRVKIPPCHERAADNKRDSTSSTDARKNDGGPAILGNRRYMSRHPTHSGRYQAEECGPINDPSHDLVAEPDNWGNPCKDFTHKVDVSTSRRMSSIQISMI